MLTTLCTRALALTFIVPATTLPPLVMPPQARGLSQLESAALQARFDPSLGSLRGGGVVAPAALGALERTELRAAEQRSATLDTLRGGFRPSEHEWTWLAIGAGIVLLLVILL